MGRSIDLVWVVISGGTESLYRVLGGRSIDCCRLVLSVRRSRYIALATFCEQSSGSLGTLGGLALGSRHAGIEGVGPPTGSGSAGRHVPTQQADLDVSARRHTPTRPADIDQHQASRRHIGMVTAVVRPQKTLVTLLDLSPDARVCLTWHCSPRQSACRIRSDRFCHACSFSS